MALAAKRQLFRFCSVEGFPETPRSGSFYNAITDQASWSLVLVLTLLRYALVYAYHCDG